MGGLLGTVVAQGASAAGVKLPFGLSGKEDPKDRKAKSGDKVLLKYKGTVQGGQVFEEQDEPVPVDLGLGLLDPKFEEAVYGMQVGEKKSVTLPPAAAYDQSLVMTFPADQLPKGIAVGVSVDLNVDGRKIPGTVTKITDEGAVVDTNPPNAGKTIEFEIELVGFQ